MDKIFSMWIENYNGVVESFIYFEKWPIQHNRGCVKKLAKISYRSLHQI